MESVDEFFVSHFINNAGVVVELEDSLIAFNRRVLPHFIELRTDIDVNRSVSVYEFEDDEYGDFYILAKWFFIFLQCVKTK